MSFQLFIVREVSCRCGRIFFTTHTPIQGRRIGGRPLPPLPFIHFIHSFSAAPLPSPSTSRSNAVPKPRQKRSANAPTLSTACIGHFGVPKGSHSWTIGLSSPTSDRSDRLVGRDHMHRSSHAGGGAHVRKDQRSTKRLLNWFSLFFSARNSSNSSLSSSAAFLKTSASSQPGLIGVPESAPSPLSTARAAVRLP